MSTERTTGLVETTGLRRPGPATDVAGHLAVIALTLLHSAPPNIAVKTDTVGADSDVSNAIHSSSVASGLPAAKAFSHARQRSRDQ